MSRYEPDGVRFSDARLGEMLYVQEGPFADWLCFQHPDGQWVTHRRAPFDDLISIGVLTQPAQGEGEGRA